MLSGTKQFLLELMAEFRFQAGKVGLIPLPLLLEQPAVRSVSYIPDTKGAYAEMANTAAVYCVEPTLLLKLHLSVRVYHNFTAILRLLILLLVTLASLPRNSHRISFITSLPLHLIPNRITSGTFCSPTVIRSRLFLVL